MKEVEEIDILSYAAKGFAYEFVFRMTEFNENYKYLSGSRFNSWCEKRWKLLEKARLIADQYRIPYKIYLAVVIKGPLYLNMLCGDWAHKAFAANKIFTEEYLVYIQERDMRYSNLKTIEGKISNLANHLYSRASALGISHFHFVESYIKEAQLTDPVIIYLFKRSVGYPISIQEYEEAKERVPRPYIETLFNNGNFLYKVNPNMCESICFKFYLTCAQREFLSCEEYELKEVKDNG